MSMSTHVVGFKPPDEKFRRMKAAYDSCKLAGVEPPKEVSDFFGETEPDDAGVEVELDELDGVEEWHDDGSQGYQIDLRKLHSDIKIVRFYNNW